MSREAGKIGSEEKMTRRGQKGGPRLEIAWLHITSATNLNISNQVRTRIQSSTSYAPSSKTPASTSKLVPSSLATTTMVHRMVPTVVDTVPAVSSSIPPNSLKAIVAPTSLVAVVPIVLPIGGGVIPVLLIGTLSSCMITILITSLLPIATLLSLILGLVPPLSLTSLRLRRMRRVLHCALLHCALYKRFLGRWCRSLRNREDWHGRWLCASSQGEVFGQFVNETDNLCPIRWF